MFPLILPGLNRDYSIPVFLIMIHIEDLVSGRTSQGLWVWGHKGFMCPKARQPVGYLREGSWAVRGVLTVEGVLRGVCTLILPTTPQGSLTPHEPSTLKNPIREVTCCNVLKYVMLN